MSNKGKLIYRVAFLVFIFVVLVFAKDTSFAYTCLECCKETKSMYQYNKSGHWETCGVCGWAPAGTSAKPKLHKLTVWSSDEHTVKCSTCGYSEKHTADFKYKNESQEICDYEGCLVKRSHDLSSWKSDSTSHWKTCSRSRCSGHIFKEASHSGGTATCMVKAKCSTCGVEYGDIGDHSYTEETSCSYIKKCKWCSATSGSHVASSTYTADETQHWKVCGGGCGTIVVEKEGHKGGTHANNGACEDCQYEYQAHANSHEVISKDNMYHYYKCELANCTGTYKEAHILDRAGEEHKLTCTVKECAYEEMHKPIWEYSDECEHKCVVTNCMITKGHTYRYSKIENNIFQHSIGCAECSLESGTEEHIDEDGNYICDKCDMQLYVLNYDILPTYKEPYTNKNVTATLEVWNTEKVYTHTFEENGEYEFILENPEKKVLAQVTWIDKEILGSITYEILENEVIATLITEENKNITITNNGGSNKYVFTENGTFTFKVVDDFGNSAEFVAYVKCLDNKSRGFISMEYYVMKTGYIFSNVKIDIDNYFKTFELFDKKFKVSVSKINVDESISAVDDNNISCVVIGVYDSNNMSIDKNSCEYLKPGKYTLKIALGGPNLFTDVSAKYKVNLNDVSLKSTSGIDMRLNTSNTNYFTVRVKEFKDLT